MMRIFSNDITHSLLGAIQVARPHSSVQAGIYALLGSFLSRGTLQFITPGVMLAAIVVMLVVASGFALNDWQDVESDKLSHPARAIPSGRISRRSAIFVAFGLAGLSLLIAATFGPWSIAWVAINLLVSSAYSLYLKGTLFLGNLAMGYLNATILIFGALAAGGLSQSVWLICGFAFVFTCAQEILYNVSDHAADVSNAVRTTAVRIGRARSIQVFDALLLLLVLGATALAQFSSRPIAYLLALGVCLIVPFMYIFSLLRSPLNDARIGRACLMMGVVRFVSVVPVLVWQG